MKKKATKSKQNTTRNKRLLSLFEVIEMFKNKSSKKNKLVQKTSKKNPYILQDSKGPFFL